ncbi:MAG TPA: hypothetical protein VGB52_10160 [Actinomycetota bacterium]
MEAHETTHERYVEQISKIERLAPEREAELLAQTRTGDRDALREVIWSYLRLTYHLAQELKPEWMEPLLAAQEANAILSQVVEAPDIDEIEPALEARLRVLFDRLEQAGSD